MGGSSALKNNEKHVELRQDAARIAWKELPDDVTLTLAESSLSLRPSAMKLSEYSQICRTEKEIERGFLETWLNW